MTGVDQADDTATMMLNLLPVLDILLVVAVSLRIFSRRSAHGTAVAWLLLVILLLVLGAAIVLAASTPWVLDQPIQPYTWTFVP